MPAPQNASLPAFFTLDNGYMIRITAQDPTDGTEVSGVVVSDASLAVDQRDASTPISQQQPVSLIAGG